MCRDEGSAVPDSYSAFNSRFRLSNFCLSPKRRLALREGKFAGEAGSADPGLASEPGGHGVKIGNVEIEIEDQMVGRDPLASGLSNSEGNQSRAADVRLKLLQPQGAAGIRQRQLALEAAEVARGRHPLRHQGPRQRDIEPAS